MKLLVLEDSENDFKILARHLRRYFTGRELSLEWKARVEPEEISETIDAYDACIVDNDLGAIKGVEVVEALTSTGTFTPLIMLTGSREKGIDKQAMASGASDFLSKSSITSDVIGRALEFGIARKTREKFLYEKAYVDPVTGLDNRAAYDDRIATLLSNEAREGTDFVVAMIDLDGFKPVNDTFGHRAGDAVLAAIGSRLRRHFDRAEMVVRLGGDEFLIVFETDGDCDRAAFGRDLERLICAPVQFEGQRVSVAFSAGILETCEFAPSMPLDRLMSEVDIRLYAHKKSKYRRCVANGTPEEAA